MDWTMCLNIPEECRQKLQELRDDHYTTYSALVSSIVVQAIEKGKVSELLAGIRLPTKYKKNKPRKKASKEELVNLGFPPPEPYKPSKPSNRFKQKQLEEILKHWELPGEFLDSFCKEEMKAWMSRWKTEVSAEDLIAFKKARKVRQQVYSTWLEQHRKLSKEVKHLEAVRANSRQDRARRFAARQLLSAKNALRTFEVQTQWHLRNFEKTAP